MRFLVMLCVLFCGVAVQAQDWTIQLEDPVVLIAGSDVDMDIDADWDGSAFAGVQVALFWNSDFLTVSNVQLGSVFAALNPDFFDWSQPPFLSCPSAPAETDFMNIGIIVDITGTGNPISTDATLFIVTMECPTTPTTGYLTAMQAVGNTPCGTAQTVASQQPGVDFPIDEANSGMLCSVFVIVPNNFIRGDVNGDDTVNIADALTGLSTLFGTNVPDCYDSLDANDDGNYNISDPIYILAYLFNGGSAPPAPFSSCGGDPTADLVPCDTPTC